MEHALINAAGTPTADRHHATARILDRDIRGDVEVAGEVSILACSPDGEGGVDARREVDDVVRAVVVCSADCLAQAEVVQQAAVVVVIGDVP